MADFVICQIFEATITRREKKKAIKKDQAENVSASLALRITCQFFMSYFQKFERMIEKKKKRYLVKRRFFWPAQPVIKL